jgi:uncharacterized membrane protein
VESNRPSRAMLPKRQGSGTAVSSDGYDPEPRWPAALAVLAVGALHWALPDSMTMGPPWLLLAIVSVLLVPTIVARRRGRHHANQVLGHALAAVVTAAMVWALMSLVVALLHHSDPPAALLRSAALIWVTNILVFASWYWRLDAGGPHARDLHGTHTEGAFLFPQMMPECSALITEPGWRPRFVDYLFLAFNTSTAFSPTDTPVLSRWAKLLMMVQSMISFTTVALLAARAVNIL